MNTTAPQEAASQAPRPGHSETERKLRLRQRRLTVGGVVVTAVWLVVLGGIAIVRSDQLVGLELNALGDFLAGAVAPLALFWLVLGYFQQGIELSLNTEALKLQYEELRQQVWETARLAGSAERQATASEMAVQEAKDANCREYEERVAAAQPMIRAAGRNGG